ncbi:MAG TPA: LapA family protein [Acidimicrobiales bacterium]|nr:LapA family protein [Acidimicrobiales bacterium]
MTEVTGGGPWDDDKRGTTDKARAVRFAVAGIAILVAALFMAQNNDRVELNFLVFSVTTRVWVGLLVTLVLGALLGQAAEVLWARRRARRSGA